MKRSHLLIASGETLDIHLGAKWLPRFLRSTIRVHAVATELVSTDDDGNPIAQINVASGDSISTDRYGYRVTETFEDGRAVTEFLSASGPAQRPSSVRVERL